MSGLISLFLLFPFFSLVCSVIKQETSIVLNSLLVIGIILISFYLNKKIPVLKKSTFLSIMLFVLFSLFLGKTLNFYAKIPNWDKFLHFVSGIIFARVGKEIYVKINGDGNIPLMILFVILFASSISGLWEIWEFTSDYILKTNAQNNSLFDTMTDMILGNLGGIVYLLLWKIKKQG